MKTEHRPPRGGRRHRRPDQGRAVPAARGDPADAALHRAEPAHLARRHAPRSSPTATHPWPAGRRPAAGRRQLVRLRRDQRPRRRRGGAAPARPRRAADGPFVLPVSAQTPAALARARPSSWPSTSTATTDADARRRLRHRRRAAHPPRRAARRRRCDRAPSSSSGSGCSPPGERRAGHRHRPAPSPASAGASPSCCSGQGPQWWAMGRELLATTPVFREVVERCDALLRDARGLVAARRARRGREAESRLDQTEVAQPALFAVQVGLAAVWRSWGVVADAVVGHSVGEVAAAHLSRCADAGRRRPGDRPPGPAHAGRDRQRRRWPRSSCRSERRRRRSSPRYGERVVGRRRQRARRPP